jgi:hypothetical protein
MQVALQKIMYRAFKIHGQIGLKQQQQQNNLMSQAFRTQSLRDVLEKELSELEVLRKLLGRLEKDNNATQVELQMLNLSMLREFSRFWM